MNRVVPRFAVLIAFLSGSLSQAVPVLLPGTTAFFWPSGFPLSSR